MSVPLYDQPTTINEELMTAVLVGGPEMRGVERVRRVPPDSDRINVEYYGGYEHFERTGTPAAALGGRGVVYRWIYRTRIAE